MKKKKANPTAIDFLKGKKKQIFMKKIVRENIINIVLDFIRIWVKIFCKIDDEF